MQGKEDDDEADDDARIESRRKKVIVPHPPTEVEAPHEPLEDETGDEPRRKADTVGRWDAAGCDQCNGDIDVAPERARTTTGEVVERDGQDCTDQEEPDEWVIAEENPSVVVI